MRRTFWDLLMDLLAECAGAKNIENPKQIMYNLRTSKAEVEKLLSFAKKHGLIKELRLTPKGVRVLDVWTELQNVVFNEGKL